MTLMTVCIHLLVLSNLILIVRSQSCASGWQYSPCSNNGQCGCLQLSFASSAFLCGVVSYDCSQFSVCQANNLCPSGYICVRHPSCDSRSLCYPMNLLTDQVCPPVSEYETTQASTIFSNYNGVLNSADGLYNRPGGSSNTYYEAIQLHVPTSGYYDLSSVSGMDTHGYLYNGTFYPSNPQTNLIAHDDDGSGNNQFKLPVYLQAGRPYTLVVSTHSSGVQGSFSVSASGPDNIYFTPLYVSTTTTTTQPLPVTSHHSGNLTSFDFHFDRTGNGSSNYYYQAYEIRVSATGTYTFTSSSGYDTYGYIYQGNFYPFQPNVNMHSQDDDAAGNGQFRLTVELRSDIKYILVFTTFAPNTFGTYTVTASGPGNVYLQPISSTFS